MARRRGRKRKLGPRHPSGDLRPKKPQVEPISGALWQRLVQYGKKLGIIVCTG